MKHSCLLYILCLIERPECYERVSDLAKLLEGVKSCFHMPHSQEGTSRRDLNANITVVFLMISQKKNTQTLKKKPNRKKSKHKTENKGRVI